MADEISRMSRRRAIASTGVVVAVGLTGCTGGNRSGGTPTATPTPTLDEQLRRVREATSQYEDPKQALADGFKPGGPYVPGMGWHFQHPERIKAAARNGLSLDKPPILTYLETESGLQLGAVEYGAPAGSVPDDPGLFNDDAASATAKWHTHKSATHVFALSDDTTTPLQELSLAEWTKRGTWAEFRPPDDGLKRGDTVSLNWGTTHGKEGERTERVVDFVTTHPDLHSVHVWVHTDNPHGVFAPTNPEFAEGSGGHGHSH